MFPDQTAENLQQVSIMEKKGRIPSLCAPVASDIALFYKKAALLTNWEVFSAYKITSLVGSTPDEQWRSTTCVQESGDVYLWCHLVFRPIFLPPL